MALEGTTIGATEMYANITVPLNEIQAAGCP
jgi:hypothetical protein